MIKPLNSLRFYVVITVFLSHLSFICTDELGTNIYNSYFRNGAIGVAFFFILSGFVINLGYGERFESITLKNYFDFVKKRIHKIYPLYVLILIVVLVANGTLINGSINIKNVLMYLTMTQTLVPKQEVAQMYTGVSWFISCIFLIYLITPFLLKINYRVRNNMLKNNIVLFVAFLVYIILLYGILKFSPDEYKIGLYYCSPFLRIFYFAFGVLLCNIFICYKNINKNHTEIVSSIFEVTLLLLFVLSFVYGPNLSTYISSKLGTESFSIIFSYSLYIFISSIMIICFAYSGGVISKFFSHKINMDLGSVSFEFYLLHYIVINVILIHITSLFHIHGRITQIIVCFVLSLALSFLTKLIIDYVFKKKEGIKHGKGNSFFDIL